MMVVGLLTTLCRNPEFKPRFQPGDPRAQLSLAQLPAKRIPHRPQILVFRRNAPHCPSSTLSGLLTVNSAEHASNGCDCSTLEQRGGWPEARL